MSIAKGQDEIEMKEHAALVVCALEQDTTL